MPLSEYAIVLGLCGLIVGFSIYALGVPLLEAYQLTKLVVLLPFP